MRRHRRKVYLVIAVITALSIVLPCSAIAARVGASEITSHGAVVLDFETGIVLYGHNENVQRVPASMIKIVAVFVAYDAISARRINIDTVASITPATREFSFDRRYSNIPLPEDMDVTIRQLLEFSLVRSACAATVALGEALFGSEEALITRMNEKAAQLGVSAKFFDCWGGSPDNRISPRGMAEMSRALIRDYPEVLRIAAMKSVTFNDITYANSNLLLGQYAGADGLKTGFTSPAGFCFIGTAVRGGRRIVAVSMGSSSMQTRDSDTTALLDYGFAYLSERVLPSGANLVLDGKTMPLSAYNIDGYHYFKLRDIAMLLSATNKQFEVDWYEREQMIGLTSGHGYTPVGGELEIASDVFRRFVPTASKVFFNSEFRELNAYNIEGYNFFRLREIAVLLDFSVVWIEESRTVIINTSAGYDPAA